MKKTEKSKFSLYFFFLIIFIYLILFFINKNLFTLSIYYLLNLFKKIYWVFILIIVLMGFSNYFLTPDKTKKYLSSKSGKKSWFFSVIFGIFSMGPVYMWYPFLADLKEKGMSDGLIACFLYNRSVKIPLLPLMFFYFGIKYVFILSFIMIFISIIQGIILEKVVNKEK
jgi:uncharacterized membrane protein YraQ (UPF0718 family)